MREWQRAMGILLKRVERRFFRFHTPAAEKGHGGARKFQGPGTVTTTQ
jgi:hypothetical protein